MRQLVTGIDSAGRSCVVHEVEIGKPGPKLERTTVFETAQSPPPPRPPGIGIDRDLNVAPGLAHWTIVQFPAGLERPMHHTDTVDFDIVLAGSIDITLGDGTHHLGPGDCVLVSGVDHAWTAGPEGCTLSVILLGSTPFTDAPVG
jgi:hypothetical protein